MNKLFANVHFIVLIFFVLLTVSDFMEHQTQLDEANRTFETSQSILQKRKKEIAAIKDYYRDIEKAKENIETAALQIEKLQRQLPNDVSNTENLEILQTIASSLNIKNVSLNPGAESDKGFYYSKEYTLKANGTFLQFLIFFERLSKVERLFNVKKMVLNIGTHRQKGRFQIIDGEVNIESYRYNTSYREDRGYGEIEKELQNDSAPKPKRKKKKNAANAGGEE